MTFTHLDAGTPEDAWERAGVRGLPRLPDPSPAAGAVLVLLAHPDDEALGCPGLLARLAEAGREVHVLLATAGERSHPRSPTQTPERLRATRLAEFDAALAELGGTITARFLDLGDGELPAHRDAILAEVDAVLADLPDPVTIVAPFSGDGHGDHETLGSIALEAGRRRFATVLEFPIWYWHWADPTDPAWRAWEFLPDPVGLDRQVLWARYPSQTRPLSELPGDEAILPPHLLAHFDRSGDTFAVTRFGDGHGRPGAMTAGVGASGTGAPNDARTAEAVFDRVHTERPDPWEVRTSAYEIAKRHALIAALSAGRFDHILEIGCSIGELSRALTAVADHVTAVDASSAALAEARRRHSRPGLDFVHVTIPDEWPAGRFDAVVLAETGYYLSPDQLEQTLDRIAESTRDDFILVLCHWTGPIEDWPLDAEQVHTICLARWPDALALHHEVGEYRLDVVHVSRTVRVGGDPSGAGQHGTGLDGGDGQR